MEREQRQQEQNRRVLELVKSGQMDQAVEALIQSAPGLSKDIAQVHLKFLTLPRDNPGLREGMRLALLGQREKAAPILSRLLEVNEDRTRQWLEFFLRGKA